MADSWWVILFDWLWGIFFNFQIWQDPDPELQVAGGSGINRSGFTTLGTKQRLYKKSITASHLCPVLPVLCGWGTAKLLSGGLPSGAGAGIPNRPLASPALGPVPPLLFPAPLGALKPKDMVLLSERYFQFGEGKLSHLWYLTYNNQPPSVFCVRKYLNPCYGFEIICRIRILT